MKKNVVPWTASALAVPLFGWVLLASAEEVGGKNIPSSGAKADVNPQASRYLDAPPDLHSTSRIPFAHDGKESRVVGISPQLKSSNNYVKGLRFHKILGALVERETPLEDGLPTIVDGIRHNPDGSAWLRFRVVVTTPEFKQRCRDAVLSQERVLLEKEKLGQDDIRIEPWPIKHCIVTMQDAFSKKTIAVSQTDTLTGTLSEFSFTMEFTADELRKVIALIDKSELEFVYTYSYVGATEHTGHVDLKSVKNVKLIASQKLRSEQVNGSQPILQGEAVAAARHVYGTVQKTMRVTHKDLIALLDQPILFQRLFVDDGQITFENLKGDEPTAVMLAAYLKPHLEQVRESFGGQKTDITIHEDKRATGNTSGGNVSASVGAPLPLPIPIAVSVGGSLSTSSTKTKEVLDRIEQATGSKWAYDKATEQFRPHAIRKLKFQGGVESVVIDESTTVFLSVGPENRYLEETPIPCTFTTKTSGMKATAVQERGLGAYEGVPLGAVLPFFGSSLPKGYRWCNGISEDPKNVFPNADWVPKHLRGTPLPDMREHLVGGAKDESAVGGTFKEGQVVLPGRAIAGSDFKLPAPTRRPFDEPLAPEDNAALKWGVVRVVNMKPNAGGWGGWNDGHYNVVNGYYKGYAGNEALAGSHNLPGVALKLDSASTNARHVMCRFVVRCE